MHCKSKSKSIKIKVYAKVNLSLNILGLNGGMHELDTIMASVDIADIITVCERFDGRVNVEFIGKNNIPKDNTVTKAIANLSLQTGVIGADVLIEKHIPEYAGLGGSSADAAGVLFALDKIHGFSSRGVNVPAIALKTGSDVPFMLEGGFGRVKQTGGAVENIVTNLNFFMVICKGINGVSTKESYAKFDELYTDKKYCPIDNDLLVTALKNNNKNTAENLFGNAMTQGSILLEPSINQTLSALEMSGATKSFMSGSGSACVGLFNSLIKAKEAMSKLQSQGLYAKAVTTKKHGIEIIG